MPYGSTGTIQDSLLGSQLIHGYEKHQNTIKMVLGALINLRTHLRQKNPIIRPLSLSHTKLHIKIKE
ncbi:MAG: hypothetical protein EAZ92_07510 [Candidatus Kapaibacterium sp.]|nr:MAG: hypothetical protein EAZ92_07510 [Candidatus Kapabacteria bacterium]